MGKQWEKDNYCTCAPDKIFGVNLKKVCYNHDVDYMNKKLSRFTADKKLFFAVLQEFTKRGRHKIGFVVAVYYFLGARVGGWFYY